MTEGSSKQNIGGDVNNCLDEEDILFSTQDNTDVFTNIRDKYGHLNKQQFCADLADHFQDNDIGIFRQSLYDYAIKNVPDTPKANLVVRLDTSHKGGGKGLKSPRERNLIRLRIKRVSKLRSEDLNLYLKVGLFRELVPNVVL